MGKRVAIIGAGFGGLAAGIRLASAGYEVEIYEKLDRPGGRGCGFEINGFQFDSGPAIIHTPEIFDRLFESAGKRRTDYVSFLPVFPSCRVFNQNGRYFDTSPDTAFTLTQIANWNPNDQQGYLDYIEAMQKIIDWGLASGDSKAFLHVTDLILAAPAIIRLRATSNVFKMVSRYIQDDFLRQVFSCETLMIGGNPYDTTCLSAALPFVGAEPELLYPSGGMVRLVNAMARLFAEIGGKIFLNCEVANLSLNGRMVKGLVTVDGAFHRADAVISDADLTYTKLRLFPSNLNGGWKTRNLEHLKYTPSLFVYNFGTSCRYDNSLLSHRNMILPINLSESMKRLFKEQALGDDLIISLSIPSRSDPSIAPEGCDNFSVMVPVPNLENPLEWETLGRLFRDRIVKFLEKNYLPGLGKNICAEHYLDPLYFRDTLNSYRGAAFAFQPALTRPGWFRPHNRSDDFENLYFVGAGTRPGAGLWGVLTSAEITTRLVFEDI